MRRYLGSTPYLFACQGVVTVRWRSVIGYIKKYSEYVMIYEPELIVYILMLHMKLRGVEVFCVIGKGMLSVSHCLLKNYFTKCIH